MSTVFSLVTHYCCQVTSSFFIQQSAPRHNYNLRRSQYSAVRFYGCHAQMKAKVNREIRDGWISRMGQTGIFFFLFIYSSFFCPSGQRAIVKFPLIKFVTFPIPIFVRLLTACFIPSSNSVVLCPIADMWIRKSNLKNSCNRNRISLIMCVESGSDVQTFPSAESLSDEMNNCLVDTVFFTKNWVKMASTTFIVP